MSKKTQLIEKVGELASKISIWLNEQEWFQELRSKWEELDPRVQTYVRYGGLGTLIVLVLTILGSTIGSVYDIRGQYQEKAELLTYIRNARELIMQIQKGPLSGTTGAAADWESIFNQKAGFAKINPEKMKVSPEKRVDSGSVADESLFTVSLSNVNIKQVIRFAFELERSTKPIKLRHLSILTESPEGYLDAELSISAFGLKE